MKSVLALLKETFAEFSKDKGTRLAAALAYYTTFSIAPLLIIAIAIAALVLGQKGATEQISSQIRDLVGGAGAVAIQSMVESANKPRSGIVAIVVGIVTLLFGSSGVFAELQDALNTIWEVPPRPNAGIFAIVKSRFLSFAMVFGTGFLLLVSLVISAAIAAFGKFLNGAVPGFETLASLLEIVVFVALSAVLFAMIFKVLPDTKIGWRDVWLGGLVTSLLFSAGKFLLALYIGKSAVGSSYGVAGSLVVVLVWVYYSSMILFFGAEFTEVYSRQHGSRSGQ